MCPLLHVPLIFTLSSSLLKCLKFLKCILLSCISISVYDSILPRTFFVLSSAWMIPTPPLSQYRYHLLLEVFLDHWAGMWGFKYICKIPNSVLTNVIYYCHTNSIILVYLHANHFNLFIHKYVLFSWSIYRSIMFLLLGNDQNAT